MNYTGAINHVNLSCSDMIKSRAFYRFLLVDLMGNTAPHHKSNPGLHHLAFSVGTHEEIDEFHSRIVGFFSSHASHGRIVDAPALYPEYGPHYYAVFFTDPDGVKLELVFSK
ncbi:hypothetical protein BGZ82_000740 [Podila clonocystis]|nr:hypothetical protein BGZ82_000740 [Podila clonocystis]